jgi:hypothetical protein
MFTLQPPSGTQPTPTDICCVIDVSGSMGTEAKLQNAEGKSEAHGLSILDIVIHAVRTIIHILSDRDRLAIVVYSTTARTILNLTTMDSTGKAAALAAIANLRPEDQTNLWDGLVTALDMMKTSTRLSHIMLLTDGQPNVVPPRGHIPMLQRYKDSNRGLPASIHTFGFGYSLDSALLNDLSVLGNGSYAFIPDSGMVGTAFVHATSNVLATMAKNATLSIEGKCQVLGGYPVSYTSWGALVTLGNIQFDQTRNIVVKSLTSDISAKLSYTTRSNHLHTTSSSPSPTSDTLVQYHRLLALDWIRAATTSTDTLPQLLLRLEASLPDPRTESLIRDLKGQVTEALSRQDWYKKWGTHYLPSLTCAHLLQQCNNFKDPGVQHYGGKLFSELRDRADDVFVKLPPPKPSAKPQAAPVTSMRTYHSSGNVCFHGDCMVTMENKSVKKVKDVKKGDLVFGGKVECVVKTTGDFVEICELPGGLLVTPYHPVYVTGKWMFPCQLAEIKKMRADVYSFVLDSGHVMEINGYICASLGHGMSGKVIGHEYFGSERVIEDLKKMIGWESGQIVLQGNCIVRDIHSNLIVGLVQEVC